MATIIFDIDGVFSPDPDSFDQTPEGFTLHSYGEAKALLNPELQTAWLKNLIETHKVVWGSKREAYSNLILKMLNLNYELPWIAIDGNDVGLGTWKIKSIKKWVEENVPPEETLIWVEDELQEDAYEWAKDRGNTYLFCPVLEEGLTAEDMNGITEKAKS